MTILTREDCRPQATNYLYLGGLLTITTNLLSCLLCPFFYLGLGRAGSRAQYVGLSWFLTIVNILPLASFGVSIWVNSIHLEKKQDCDVLKSKERGLKKRFAKNRAIFILTKIYPVPQI